MKRRFVEEDDVRTVKHLLKIGNTPKAIVDVLGLSGATIYKNKNGVYDSSVWEPCESETTEATEQTATDNAGNDSQLVKKLLYEACMTNYLLRKLLEKWE